MSPLWVWAWNNIEALSVLVPMAFAGLTWAVRMLLASKKRVDGLIDTVNKMAMVFQPEDGPNLAETLQVMASTQTAMLGRMKSIEAGQQSMVARQRADLEDEEAPVFEADLNGEIVFANTAYLDLVGYSVMQMRGRGWEVILHPDDTDRIIKAWRLAVTGRRIFNATFCIVSRGNRTFEVRCVAKPLVCEANIVTGFRGRYFDATEKLH